MIFIIRTATIASRFYGDDDDDDTLYIYILCYTYLHHYNTICIGLLDDNVIHIPVFHLCSAAEWAEPSDEPPRQPIIQACCTVDYYLETIVENVLRTYLLYIHTYVCKYSQSYDLFSFFSSHFISKIFHHNVSAYMFVYTTAGSRILGLSRARYYNHRHSSPSSSSSHIYHRLDEIN